MGLRARFNLAFVLIFGIGLVLTGILFYYAETQQAQEEVQHQAELLLSSALATRNYTVSQVRPLISAQSADNFLPQTVPSYAAQETFLVFNEDFPEFTYREAALNPTNPRDLARSWEVDIIQEMIIDDSGEQMIGNRNTEDGRVLFYARPIRITNEACLVCHSTPDVAPASMISIYGADGGFGWGMDDIIGAQIVTVPMSLSIQRAQETTLTLVGALFSVFTLVLVAVNILLDQVFIRPLRRIAQVTERYSRGEVEIGELDGARGDEIGRIEKAMNRLRRSLEKAMQVAETRNETERA